MKLRPGTWRAELRGTKFAMMSCIASGVLQWCIPAEEGKELLLDTHVGVCGHHASTRSMVGKAFQQGFYWPRAASNVAQIVTSYRGCQYFMRQTHVPAHEL
jgi:hypothetical protein